MHDFEWKREEAGEVKGERGVLRVVGSVDSEVEEGDEEEEEGERGVLSVQESMGAEMEVVTGNIGHGSAVVPDYTLQAGCSASVDRKSS